MPEIIHICSSFRLLELVCFLFDDKIIDQSADNPNQSDNEYPDNFLILLFKISLGHVYKHKNPENKARYYSHNEEEPKEYEDKSDA